MFEGRLAAGDKIVGFRPCKADDGLPSSKSAGDPEGVPEGGCVKWQSRIIISSPASVSESGAAAY